MLLDKDHKKKIIFCTHREKNVKTHLSAHLCSTTQNSHRAILYPVTVQKHQNSTILTDLFYFVGQFMQALYVTRLSRSHVEVHVEVMNLSIMQATSMFCTIFSRYLKLLDYRDRLG